MKNVNNYRKDVKFSRMQVSTNAGLDTIGQDYYDSMAEDGRHMWLQDRDDQDPQALV